MPPRFSSGPGVRTAQHDGFPRRELSPEVRSIIRNIKEKARRARAEGLYWQTAFFK
jgi:hypothetical protein